MKRVIVLTGSELRHTYFRLSLAADKRFRVLASFCEGNERSLRARTFSNEQSSWLERQHVLAREQSEQDFFLQFVETTEDNSNPTFLKKGQINDESVVDSIEQHAPDLLACYGSSLVKSRLLKRFEGRFLNAHLGLSPYYRGSGTNVWPIINGELEMVGATFMYIDEGIDTGNIIHQVRADIFLGDSPHTIGNRLIKKMTDTYADLIANFEKLNDEDQPTSEGRFYYHKDFDAEACAKLYENISGGLVERYLEDNRRENLETPFIVSNRALGDFK